MDTLNLMRRRVAVGAGVIALSTLAILIFTERGNFFGGDNAEDFRERAYLNLTQQRYALALSELDTSIRMNPNSTRAFENRGFVHLRMGRPDLAIRDLTRSIQLHPNANGFGLRGMANAQRGENEAALRDFNTALKIDPRHADAYRGRADLYEGIGDLVEAFKNQQMAMSLEPNVASDFLTRALLLDGLGRDEEALKDSAKAIALDPKSSFAYNNRANIWMQRKDYVRALADYNKALSLSQYAAAYKNRGDCYSKLKRHDQAITDYTSAMELSASHWTRLARADAYIARGPKFFDRAKADLTILSATVPTNHALSLSMASAYLRLGEGLTARRYIDAARESAKGFDPSPLIMYVHGLVLKAVGKISAGQSEIDAARSINSEIDQEIVEFNLIPDASPGPAKARSQAVATFTGEGVVDECVGGRTVTGERRRAVCTKRLAGSISQSERISALYGRSIAYQKLKQWQSAIADLNAILELDPKQVSALSGIADVLAAKGDKSGALLVYGSAIKAFPQDPSQWGKRCWFRSRFRLELEEALKDCEHALVLQPGADYLYGVRGFTHLVRNEFAKAVQDYNAELRQLVPGFPGNPMSLFGRGIAKLRLGDSDGGRADIAAATAIEPSIAHDFASWGLKP